MFRSLEGMIRIDWSFLIIRSKRKNISYIWEVIARITYERMSCRRGKMSSYFSITSMYTGRLWVEWLIFTYYARESSWTCVQSIRLVIEELQCTLIDYGQIVSQVTLERAIKCLRFSMMRSGSLCWWKVVKWWISFPCIDVPASLQRTMMLMILVLHVYANECISGTH
jgi:hypothetical protein